MDSSYFNDERNDIFELSTAPKVLQLYRGDTHVVYVNLKVPSSAINSIIFNCDGLPDATALTLESTTLTTSSWKLTLNKSQTSILLPKTHNFTMTVIGLDLTELTLYKGLVIANNRIFSNSSNNYYLSALIKFVAPTIADNAYQIGTIWIDVVLNRVHVFTSLNDDDEAYWLDVTKLIRDALVGDEPFTAINLNNKAMLTFNGTDVVWSYRGINAEMFKNLILEVEPASGVTFTNGMCVMYAGSIGGSGKRLAKPTNFAELKLNPGLFLGVITQISDDGNGIVNWYGEVNNLNTQDLVLGSPVYVGDNGSWTTIKPTSPNPQISIGLIERAHVEQGRISVRPRINCYLSELHDVYVNGHTFIGGEIIKYNFTNSRWEIFNLDGSLLTISTNISDIQGDIIDINTNLQALDLNKVDKLLTIIGLDLQNNITLDEFKIALGNATTSLDGLLSSEDKVHINNFVTLFENDSTEILDTIALILQIFETYPEGTDIMTLLEGKVDKVTGYGLSKNNLSDELKQQYDAAYTHTSDISNPHSVTKAQIGLENVDDTSDLDKPISTATQSALNNKQDKLIAGLNISIVGNTISASGGGGEGTQDISAAEVKALYESNADTNAFTDTEKTKLSGIQAGAEVNVQSDWTQAVNTADDYIKNKPAIPTKISDLTNDAEYITGYTETDPIFTAWNKSTGISITKSQVSDLIEATQSLAGLMSATDKQRLDVLHALLEEDTSNSVVDSINEVLSIFNNYPEGADLVTALAGKVDKTSIVDNLTTDDATKVLSAKQGKVLNDNVALKVNISDIVDNLTSTDTNKPLSANQGKVLNDAVALKVNKADIVDNLTSTDTNKPLSANQGKVLNDALGNIDTILDSILGV